MSYKVNIIMIISILDLMCRCRSIIHISAPPPGTCSLLGEHGGLVVNASDSGSRGRGSRPTRVKQCCVLEQGTYSPKVLVIPRKLWLRPNMTEKLFTGTLRINQPTNQSTCSLLAAPMAYLTLDLHTSLSQGQPR